MDIISTLIILGVALILSPFAMTTIGIAYIKATDKPRSN